MGHNGHNHKRWILTPKSRRAGAVEVCDEVDAGGAVGAGRRPALVPVRLAVRPREAVLAVAVVASPKMEDRLYGGTLI